MHILVVNPNTTASMTAKIGEAANAAASPGTRITAVNPHMGPVSIEGHYDEALCLPGLLDCVRKGETDGIDGTVVACFDDPGIGAAREVASGPVVGICEAAMHMAGLLGERFSVVTTLPRAIPVIEELALRYGCERRLRRVRAADVAVLALEEPGGEAQRQVRAEVERAARDDGSDVVILGCAGMADLTRRLTDASGIPVLDGVACGVRLIEALVGLGLRTSKRGGYAWPRAKRYTGALERFAPKPR